MIIRRSDFEQHGIKIQPFIESPNEFVVHDLHIGDVYHIPGEARSDPHKIDSRLILQPGRSVVIYTQELITIDGQQVFGQLTSKASWVAQGLVIANTKIDPRYGVGTPNAHLSVLVYNASEQPCILQPGVAFCSIYFVLVEQPIPSSHPRNPPAWPSQRQNKSVDFLSRNKLIIATLVSGALGGVVGAFVQAYLSGMHQ